MGSRSWTFSWLYHAKAYWFQRGPQIKLFPCTSREVDSCAPGTPLYATHPGFPLSPIPPGHCCCHPPPHAGTSPHSGDLTQLELPHPGLVVLSSLHGHLSCLAPPRCFSTELFSKVGRKQSPYNFKCTWEIPQGTFGRFTPIALSSACIVLLAFY